MNAQRGPEDDSPDMLVTASMFAGLMAFFAALLVVFNVGAGAAGPKQREYEQGVDAERPQLYFGRWDQAVFVFPDRVVFPDDPQGAFEVPTESVPRNQRIRDYARRIAAQQQTTQASILFAVHPGANVNEFWVETMMGDAGVLYQAVVRFHPDCLHILEDDPDGRELMRQCINREPPNE